MGFYCDKHVASGRTQKTCDECNKTIGVGKPSWTVPGENFETSYHFHDKCYEKITKKFSDLDEWSAQREE